ncbi:hypothetical protein [Actinobaculum sp. 313]|uniref:hypothetical protein n=1 Tax=Actinobaculum sp. 313 TaxID=2495645 RepID=UPI000F743ECA|nr:hypothetical protein [Actinobaculum sp. 313]
MIISPKRRSSLLPVCLAVLSACGLGACSSYAIDAESSGTTVEATEELPPITDLVSFTPPAGYTVAAEQDAIITADNGADAAVLVSIQPANGRSADELISDLFTLLDGTQPDKSELDALGEEDVNGRSGEGFSGCATSSVDSLCARGAVVPVDGGYITVAAMNYSTDGEAEPVAESTYQELLTGVSWK